VAAVEPKTIFGGGDDFGGGDFADDDY